MNENRRLFFALLPDDHTQQALQQLSTALPLTTRQRIRAENFHITLVFIGSVNKELMPKIIELAQPIKIQAMSLVFDQLEYWRGADVLCLTCSRPEPLLTNLVTQLSTPLADLEIKLDTRPYCPHVTLARHIHELPTTKFQPITWNAQQFALMESVSDTSGVIYQPLQVW